MQPTPTFKLAMAARTSRPALAAVQLNSPRPTPTKTPTKMAAARRHPTDAANVAAAAAATMAAAAACGMARAAVEAAALSVAAVEEELVELSRLGLPTVPGYDLIEKLGCGGFGSVYLARAPGGCEVALKIVSHGGRISHEAGSEALAEFDPEEAEHEASVHRRRAAAIPRHPRAAGPGPRP